MRKVLVIACITALALFGAGGVRQEERRWRRRWWRRGEINISLTSFPDYVDPQLSYTVEGWDRPLERLHPAADLQAPQG